MRKASYPYVADNDELLLGSHLLLALEQGGLDMHAVDFYSIAATAAKAMNELTTQQVVRLRDAGPSSIRALAENALHGRGIVDWMSDRESHVRAAAAWSSLRQRIADGCSS